MYKACQSITVSNPIRKEETNSMNMTEISVSIINENIGQTKKNWASTYAVVVTYEQICRNKIFYIIKIINKNI